MNVLKVCGAGAAVFNGHAFYVTTWWCSSEPVTDWPVSQLAAPARIPPPLCGLRRKRLCNLRCKITPDIGTDCFYDIFKLYTLSVDRRWSLWVHASPRNSGIRSINSVAIFIDLLIHWNRVIVISSETYVISRRFGSQWSRQYGANRIVTQYDRLLASCVCLSICDAVWRSWSVQGDGGWKLYHRIPGMALPIHFFRHFCCVIYSGGFRLGPGGHTGTGPPNFWLVP